MSKDRISQVDLNKLQLKAQEMIRDGYALPPATKVRAGKKPRGPGQPRKPDPRRIRSASLSDAELAAFLRLSNGKTLTDGVRKLIEKKRKK